jgi:hypothetical protein
MLLIPLFFAVTGVTTSQASIHAGSHRSRAVTRRRHNFAAVTREPSIHAGCDVVTPVTAIFKGYWKHAAMWLFIALRQRIFMSYSSHTFQGAGGKYLVHASVN